MFKSILTLHIGYLSAITQRRQYIRVICRKEKSSVIACYKNSAIIIYYVVLLDKCPLTFSFILVSHENVKRGKSTNEFWQVERGLLAQNTSSLISKF